MGWEYGSIWWKNQVKSLFIYLIFDLYSTTYNTYLCRYNCKQSTKLQQDVTYQQEVLDNFLLVECLKTGFFGYPDKVPTCLKKNGKGNKKDAYAV